MVANVHLDGRLFVSAFTVFCMYEYERLALKMQSCLSPLYSLCGLFDRSCMRVFVCHSAV